MSERPSIGVGMLGYAFMGKAHSRAFHDVLLLSPPLLPEPVSISGRNGERVEEARARYGWAEAVPDWREQVADPRVALFDNGGPNNLHAEPTIEAARNGKHAFCEEPLGLDAAEAHGMWRAAEDADIVHTCGFNYRFVPAIRRARELIDSGALHVIHKLRGQGIDNVKVNMDWSTCS